MLLANEYLTPVNPIRHALLFKFKERISYESLGAAIPLNEDIISGRKLAQLNPKDKAIIGTRVVKIRRGAPQKPNINTSKNDAKPELTVRLKLRRESRLAVRLRRNNPPRFSGGTEIFKTCARELKKTPVIAGGTPSWSQ
jgi:hypothetical protein